MEINFAMKSENGSEVIPKYLEDMVDDAVTQDFLQVQKISNEDRRNETYSSMVYSLQAAGVEILYERVVISEDKLSWVIPHKQYLFGFKPTEGLCIFSNKEQHKSMLCDGPIRELAKQCPLTQSLQYILVPTNEFRVWSYIPVCCSADETCPIKTRPFGLRRNLFEE